MISGDIPLNHLFHDKAIGPEAQFLRCGCNHRQVNASKPTSCLRMRKGMGDIRTVNVVMR